ncbi:MAG: polyprenyl synthetase family protein [Bacteroidetes bacterium]|nr:polyprenyl synthetase family protein [Bacteroidota bacterium]MBU1484965.1 polyprenyl synthetase family protein [Bacteroidota bacterium]MBU2266682.1 polyprenyl synthetase family protein [Bacteroidota bacterium]MBU2374882.1 polyprenyl synthetase family protein [Bacteroidota bacterium]
MHSIQELQQIIDQAVKDTTYPSEPKELYEPISYLMALGGKRLRPAMVLMATDLFGGDIQEALAPALAVELFHNFTLMHDDIMDKAPLRRGQPTVHAKWNEAVAILSGDVMFVKAYKMMIQVKPDILSPVLEVFNQTAVGVCEGQQIDMNFERRAEVSIPEYVEMIRLKTAVLVGGALKIGALIGNASEKDAQLLYEFGENLGIAFQLQDDILDVYGDPEKFGKQVGGDIISNKKTFLLIKALELAEGETAKSLNHWLNLTQFDAEAKVKAVRTIYDVLGIRELSESIMLAYADKATSSFNGINIPENNKTTLLSFANLLIKREN